MSVDVLTLALEILPTNREGIHVDQLAAAILKKYPAVPFDHSDLSARLSSRLSYIFREKKGIDCPISKIKNKSGGFKKGYYRLKPNRRSSTVTVAAPEKLSTNYVGKGGEHAVLSELLFRGYNAAIMSVDEGIDIVASKDNKYFHIQVKASVENENTYNFKIKRNIFENNDNSGTFYVFLCRSYKKTYMKNDYIVLSSVEIGSLIKSGGIKNSENLSLRVKMNNNKYMLNGSVDLSYAVNQFEMIR